MSCVLLAGGMRAKAAQTVSGTVRDARTLLPIPYAVVAVEETNEVTEADAHGQFVLSSLPDGEYHLCVQRIGYKRTCDIAIRVGPEEFMAPIVLLRPQPLDSRGIEVIASRTDSEERVTPISEIITSKQIKTSGASTAAEALRFVSGVDVIEGGQAETQVSIRGSRPDAVAVLVDGVPLGPSGEAYDLSSIPATSIESIEILKGPSAAYAGADALGGAILITTRPPDLHLNGEAYGAGGSFGHESAGAKVKGIGIGSQRLNAGWHNEFARGDFPYLDTLYGVHAIRENNWLHRQDYSIRGVGPIGSGWSWHASGSHSRTHAGTPGPLYELTPDASRRDRRELYSASVENTMANGILDLSYARSRSWTYYEITGIQPQRTESDASEDVLRSGFEWRRTVLAGAALNAEYTRENLEGTDHRNPAYSFGTATRDNYAMTARYTREFEWHGALIDRLCVVGGYRYDQSETEANYPKTAISPVVEPPRRVWRIWSPNANAGLYGAVSVVVWNLSVGYGKAYRRAGLMELFLDETYLTRGNPGLRPERSEQTEIGYSLGLNRKVSVEFSQRFYWSRYTDLIYWRLGAGRIWSPANIGRAHIDGREDALRLKVFGNALVVDLRHLFQDHRNTSGEANTDGQPLPFRYRHKTSLAVRSSWRWGFAELSRRWYDRRYLREAGTVARSLEPYGTTDVSSGVHARRWGVQGEITLRVENLDDIAYEVIERQPMPGRSFRVSIQLKR